MATTAPPSGSTTNAQGGTASTVTFEAIGRHTYRVPRSGAMRVDAVFFASPDILSMLEQEAFASLRQLVNVASLPGVVEPVLAMPDIHWGYGFPIGGVAAFDPEAGGVVSPGGVGYDINCGVRLLVSRLDRADVERVAVALADALYLAVPSGVGSTLGAALSDDELDRVLVRGARAMVERGFGSEDDVMHIESHGALPGADPARVSRRARNRGARQLGSLGSGNHFVEVQVVDEIYDEAAAAA